MKRKRMAMIVSAILVMGLAGCGSAGSNAGTTADNKTVENATAGNENAESTVAPTEEPGNNESSTNTESAADNAAFGKTLVVYYSATGNTENAANIIAKQTDADLFELEPAEPYTDDDLNWTNSDSRVSVEHDNPDERDVELTAVTVDDWDTYDTIYIGYPIWWGIAAWPVDTFVEGNDFTGKTVIPFATATSSGLGESGDLLQEMAGTGDWLEGECFRDSRSEEDIKEWVESLGL